MLDPDFLTLLQMINYLFQTRVKKLYFEKLRLIYVLVIALLKSLNSALVYAGRHMFSKTVYSPEFSFLNSSKHRIAIVLVSSLESFLADQWPTERLYKVISDPVGESIYYSAAQSLFILVKHLYSQDITENNPSLFARYKTQ